MSEVLSQETFELLLVLFGAVIGVVAGVVAGRKL